MSEPERDEHTGVETTGHEWDGITELDNPLPRWWLWIFYGCIAFSIIYWVLMPAWPGLSGYTPGLMKQSDRADLVTELTALQVQRGRDEAQLVTASLQEIEADPALQAHALAIGQSVFGDNCASCHGAGGGGAKGYPNLRDDVWLWGGSLEEIPGLTWSPQRSKRNAGSSSITVCPSPKTRWTKTLKNQPGFTGRTTANCTFAATF